MDSHSELAWSDLAGEVVIFVILGSAGSDENGADLRKVCARSILSSHGCQQYDAIAIDHDGRASHLLQTQEDLEANGERVTLIGIPSKRQQGERCVWSRIVVLFATR